MTHRTFTMLMLGVLLGLSLILLFRVGKLEQAAKAQSLINQAAVRLRP